MQYTSVVDYEAQMKKLSSLVKRGGHVLFAASTLVDDSLDYYYDHYQFPGSNVSFTGITLSMRTLVKIMEKSGLTIISSIELIIVSPDFSIIMIAIVIIFMMLIGYGHLLQQ